MKFPKNQVMLSTKVPAEWKKKLDEFLMKVNREPERMTKMTLRQFLILAGDFFIKNYKGE